jgi:hypothetical protein
LTRIVQAKLYLQMHSWGHRRGKHPNFPPLDIVTGVQQGIGQRGCLREGDGGEGKVLGLGLGETTWIA